VLDLASRSAMKNPNSSPVATAVVLSLSKQSYLRSQLAYYADKPIHLILADGSDSDWGNGSSGTFGDTTWEYFRLSGASTYFARLKEACGRINTKYAFLLDDEDCTLWTGITTAIAFLEMHPDYSAAGGGVAFSAGCSRRLGLVTGHRYRPIDLAQHEPIARLRTLLANRKSAHIVYQVLRTEVLHAYATSMADISSEIPLGFAGRSFSWFLALSGKWMSTDSPYSIRRQSPRTSATRELPNQVFTTEVAAELSRRVIQALDDLGGCDHKDKNSINLKTVTSMMLSHYSLSSTYQEKRPPVYANWISESLAPGIFSCFPALYERLRPTGIQSILRYAESFDAHSSKPQFHCDLSEIERLWLKHPQGLSKVEFENYLSNN
jgi:glycosyltransferase domain-containing protein